jgi:hypothetical protein
VIIKQIRRRRRSINYRDIRDENRLETFHYLPRRNLLNFWCICTEAAREINSEGGIISSKRFIMKQQ